MIHIGNKMKMKREREKMNLNVISKRCNNNFDEIVMGMFRMKNVINNKYPLYLMKNKESMIYYKTFLMNRQINNKYNHN